MAWSCYTQPDKTLKTKIVGYVRRDKFDGIKVIKFTEQERYEV
jgi:hypothetical protein